MHRPEARAQYLPSASCKIAWYLEERHDGAWRTQKFAREEAVEEWDLRARRACSSRRRAYGIRSYGRLIRAGWQSYGSCRYMARRRWPRTTTMVLLVQSTVGLGFSPLAPVIIVQLTINKCNGMRRNYFSELRYAAACKRFAARFSSSVKYLAPRPMAWW